MFKIFPFALLCACAAMAQQGPATFQRADVRSGNEPGVRYNSGLTVCDDVLRQGHWVNRYWLSSGMVKPEFHLDLERRLFDGLSLDAFELSLEGQDLDRKSVV